MKYLKSFRLNESLSLTDLDEILLDLRDDGIGVEVKEGWVSPENIEKDFVYGYEHKVAYSGSIKACFIRLFKDDLDPDILFQVLEDMQIAKERMEEIGEVGINYYIQTNTQGKKIAFYCDIRLLLTNQVHSFDTIGEFRKILTDNGYQVVDCQRQNWKYALTVILPKVKIPKLDKPFADLGSKSKIERRKLVGSLKREPYKENREKIRNLLNPVAKKHNLDLNFYDRDGMQKMDIAFRARYDRDEGEDY